MQLNCGVPRSQEKQMLMKEKKLGREKKRKHSKETLKPRREDLMVTLI